MPDPTESNKSLNQMIYNLDISQEDFKNSIKSNESVVIEQLEEYRNIF